MPSSTTQTGTPEHSSPPLTGVAGDVGLLDVDLNLVRRCFQTNQRHPLPELFTQAIKASVNTPGDAAIVATIASLQGWGRQACRTPNATPSAVIRQIRVHTPITSQVLRQVFGDTHPETRLITQHAATLTASQIRRLHDAHAALAESELQEARYCLNEALIAETWHRMWASNAANTCHLAARRPVNQIAADTAKAATAKELITPTGFTAGHYQTLTTAWVTTIGGLT